MRRLTSLALALLALGACRPALAVLFGRFAQPSLTGEGTLANFSHNVVVERGFKLQYLPLQRAGEYWGAPVFAGFVSVLLDGKEPAYTLIPPERPGQGTQMDRATSQTLGRYAKWHHYGERLIKVTCEEGIGLPLAHFDARAVWPAGTAPVHMDWLITGWKWAGQQAPDRWAWWQNGRLTPLARDHGSWQVPSGKGILLAWHEGSPYTLAFLTSAPLAEIRPWQDGVILRFTSTPRPLGNRLVLPDLYVAPLAPRPGDHLLALLPEMAHPWPRLTFAMDARGRPVAWFWGYWGKPGSPPMKVIPIPPPFSSRVVALCTQETPLGPVAYVRGPERAVPLPLPPRLECLVEAFPPLPPQEQGAVATDVEAILSQQQEDGQFRFSLGRPFYDGQTAGVLVQLAPLLAEPLRTRTNAAVRRTLDYWWGRLTRDEKTGLVHFPEPSGAVQVDYPEISATVLYPTAAYAALVDREYARALRPKFREVAASLGAAYDITGSAWAHPGPNYVHVLTESTIGGYLAYASLYHLERLSGSAGSLSAGLLRARACWAWAAMDLYRWRPEYGRGGILSQWFAHGMFVEPALAWDYTMPTWFSWCPLWSLPAASDPYHVFMVLEQQHWWEYFHASRQLAYDWSHFIAYMRFGKVEEGLAHYQEILAHEPSFDNFDTVALYRPLGRAWRVKALVGR